MTPEPRESPVRRLLPWLALTLLYTGLTLAYVWPLPRLWGDHIGPGLDDPLFVLYVLKWGARQIALGLPDVWDANLFFPTRGTLAYSDHLLGAAAQLFLFLKIVPNPIAGYNFLFLSSFVASALSVYWVLRRSGLSWIAAGLAGWMYAFAPFRLLHLLHLQILLAQWIPLTLWFWDRLLARRTVRNAALFLLFYLLHLSGSCYLAYMIHFPLLAILLSRLLSEGRELLSLRSLRVLLPVAAVAGACAALLFLPYARVARAQKLSRQPVEFRYFGAHLASYVSPDEHNLYEPAVDRMLRPVLGRSIALFHRPENALFAGFLPTLLFFVGAAAALRGLRDGPVDPWARGIAFTGLLCFALTFAWIYAPLAAVVPGLSGMRVPARFYAFTSFAIVYFAARGTDGLLRRLPGPRARVALAAGLAALLAVELAPRRIVWDKIPREEQIPRAYSWIRDQPGVKALVELPLYADGRENAYLYSSTVHWKPLANGYSGYFAESYRRLFLRIRSGLPRADGLDLIRGLGITHVVVHPGKLIPPQAVERWEKEFGTGPGRRVEKVYEEPGILIYRILPR
jgi:hypothetical protein